VKNPGKEFEKDIKQSVSSSIWYYRLRDGTATFYGGMQQDNGVRFQQTNICDIILFRLGTMALLELKSHKGKSLPHNQFKNSKGDIKHLDDLRDAAEYEGIEAGAIINMRDVGETYYLPADTILLHMTGYYGEAKSIPIAFMRDHGYRVWQEKKRTRYRYDIDGLMNYLKVDWRRSL